MLRCRLRIVYSDVMGQGGVFIFRRRRKVFLLGLALACALALAGCRVRAYMIPMIVSGELDKIAKSKPHRTWYQAVLTWDGLPREVAYLVSYQPPHQLLYEIREPADAAGTALSVDLNQLVYRDPAAKYFERLAFHGPSNEEEFKQARKAAYSRTLEDNQVNIQSGKGEFKGCWAVRTEPLPDNTWGVVNTAYVDDKTKQTVRVEEAGADGKVLDALWAVRKEEVATPASAFALRPEPGWTEAEADFTALPDGVDAALAAAAQAPPAVAGLELRAAALQNGARLFDYSRQGTIFAVAEFPRPDLGARNPNARQMHYRGLTLYLSYAGNYTTLTTFVDGHRVVIVSSLGPGPIFEFTDAALVPRLAAKRE